MRAYVYTIADTIETNTNGRPAKVQPAAQPTRRSDQPRNRPTDRQTDRPNFHPTSRFSIMQLPDQQPTNQATTQPTDPPTKKACKGRAMQPKAHAYRTTQHHPTQCNQHVEQQQLKVLCGRSDDCSSRRPKKRSAVSFSISVHTTPTPPQTPQRGTTPSPLCTGYHRHRRKRAGIDFCCRAQPGPLIWGRWHYKRPVDQPTNRPTDQLNDQPTNQPTDEWENKITDQPDSLPNYRLSN